MPISYSILKDPAILLVSYKGIVTNDDFLVGYRKAYADPRYIPGMNEISDMRPMDVYGIYMAGIQQMVTWLAGRDDLEGKTIRIGVVVKNELHGGVSKLYRAVSGLYDKEDLATFSDPRAALEWHSVDKALVPLVIAELSNLAVAPLRPLT